MVASWRPGLEAAGDGGHALGFSVLPWSFTVFAVCYLLSSTNAIIPPHPSCGKRLNIRRCFLTHAIWAQYLVTAESSWHRPQGSHDERQRSLEVLKSRGP